MGSDSMTNASIPAFSRDIGKKKRTNRSAKLKHRKIDARREQWLSQVKNKDCKETKGRSLPLPLIEERNGSLGDSQTRSLSEENNDLHESDDLETLINSSPNLPTKDRPGSSSSSSSSSGFCLGKFSEDEDDDDNDEGKDGSLDDWEAVADALIADEERHSNSETEETLVESITPPKISSSSNNLKPQCEGMIPRAWRPDDALRPQSLPNLSKNHSFPMNSVRLCGATNWGCHIAITQPSSCPICYEDLDLTDSSFLPCTCGFRLCLFCHKRILEVDGRCPGCRKPYGPVKGEMGVNGGSLPFRLARSCSMSTRS
eukprot:TRINITY_DN2224_c0_g1_i1.p1 TRINITY_DN2224_c0_g1~~TRINITY_DN2224_c0_g1_i1.p1  ORF type:complete len:315 (-),score=45.00 TRINITY_DN2224_c0_g1_i1:187-1131(-)